MKCDGSGKIGVPIIVMGVDMQPDCPGCEDCRCSDCEGEGKYWYSKQGTPFPSSKFSAPPPDYLKKYYSERDCPTCNGTGRKGE